MVLSLIERILSEATALLVLMGAVMPDQVLATELFRLTWLGRTPPCWQWGWCW